MYNTIEIKDLFLCYNYGNIVNDYNSYCDINRAYRSKIMFRDRYRIVQIRFWLRQSGNQKCIKENRTPDGSADIFILS